MGKLLHLHLQAAADPLLRSLHFDQITSKWANSCTCISRPSWETIKYNFFTRTCPLKNIGPSSSCTEKRFLLTGKDIWHFSQRAMLGHLKDVWTHWFLKSLFPILLLVPPLQAMFLWNSGTCRDLWYEGGKKSCTLLFPTKAADPLLRSLHFDQIASTWTNSCTCISRPLQIHYFAALILIK